jgi:hypothetical protein
MPVGLHGYPNTITPDKALILLLSVLPDGGASSEKYRKEKSG